MRKTDYELLSDTELQQVLRRSSEQYERGSLSALHFATLSVTRWLRIGARVALRRGRELTELFAWLAWKAATRFASASLVERLCIAWSTPFLITLFVRRGLGFGSGATAGVWIATFGAVLVFQHQSLSRRLTR